MEFEEIIKVTPTKRKSNKWLVAAVSLLLLIVVLSGYYLLYSFFKNQDKIEDWTTAAEELIVQINTGEENLALIKKAEEENGELSEEPKEILQTAVEYYQPILITEETTKNIDGTELTFPQYQLSKKNYKNITVSTMQEDTIKLRTMNATLKKQLEEIAKHNQEKEAKEQIKTIEKDLTETAENLHEVSKLIGEIQSMNSVLYTPFYTTEYEEKIEEIEYEMAEVRTQFNKDPNFIVLSLEAENILDSSQHLLEEVENKVKELRKDVESIEEELRLQQLEEEAEAERLRQEELREEQAYQDMLDNQYQDELDELYNWDSREKEEVEDNIERVETREIEEWGEEEENRD